MTNAHVLCHCPACRVQSAVHLLKTSRPSMALTVLKELPALIVEALEVKGAEREGLTAEVRELGQRIAARRQELRQLVRASRAPRHSKPQRRAGSRPSA
jgi:hypothetical protein